MKSDNLRPIPRERERMVDAAFQLLESVENGTGVVPAGVAVDVGGKIEYRSLAGDGFYDAIVVRVIGPDLVDVDVLPPGCLHPVRVTGVALRSRHYRSSFE